MNRILTLAEFAELDEMLREGCVKANSDMNARMRLPSAADLDAVEEEKRVRDLTS